MCSDTRLKYLTSPYYLQDEYINSSLKNIHRLSGISRQAKEFFDKFSI